MSSSPSPMAPVVRLVILTAFSCQSADYLTLLFRRSPNTTFNNFATAFESIASKFSDRVFFLPDTVYRKSNKVEGLKWKIQDIKLKKILHILARMPRLLCSTKNAGRFSFYSVEQSRSSFLSTAPSPPALFPFPTYYH